MARFAAHPHRTVLALSLPVVISLVAEPITGLVDTAFVARLGAAELAALGVATVLLTSSLWVFNFLGVGTQTEVAQAVGAGKRARGREVYGVAALLAGAIGTGLGLLAWPLLPWLVAAMGAQGEVATAARVYLGIRLLGGPPMLVTMAAMGALRGLHDMRAPLGIAVGTQVVHVALDALLILGAGPIPALGVAGAAWAAVASQWAGGFVALAAVRSRLGGRRPTRSTQGREAAAQRGEAERSVGPREGLQASGGGPLHGLGRPERVDLRDARSLLVVGRDMFLRTGLLVTFILLTTRAATRIGTDAGAAHQAIRQVWLTTALILDAYAAVAQSLVGTGMGAGRIDLARRAAEVATRWSLVSGVAIGAAMLAGESWVATALVPESARGLFSAAWRVAALAQPINALSFATDGVHWGTRDYRYLRDVMALSTTVGVVGLTLGEWSGRESLFSVWAVTTLWIAVRGVFGVGRVWPGWGHSPLRAPPAEALSGGVA